MLISYPVLKSPLPASDAFTPKPTWKPHIPPKDDKSGLGLEDSPGQLAETEDPLFDKEMVDVTTAVQVPASALDPLDESEMQRQAVHGTYPVSADRRWHGGIHLAFVHNMEAVRAVADGKLVAALHTSGPVEDASGRPCDRSFVLLRHDTEIGARRIPGSGNEPARLEPVTFTYFSLSMHLGSAQAELAAGAKRAVKSAKAATGYARPLQELPLDQLVMHPDPATAPRVYRREVLGVVGKMQGSPQVQLEIFTTAEQLAQIPDTEALVQQKRSSDRLPWGKLYFYIPPNTAFLASPARAKHGYISRNPASLLPEKDGKPPKPTGRYYESVGQRSVYFPPRAEGRNAVPLVVEMWYHKGNRYFRVLKETDSTPGMPHGKQYVPLGEAGQAYETVGYEYKIRDSISRMYPATPSAGVDLLRFGRIVGRDEAAAGEADCWVAVPFGEGSEQIGYVDLAQPGVLKYSDADFPHFNGWRRVKEAHAHVDGKVDVDFLVQLLGAADANRDGKTTPEELALHLRRHPQIHKRLRYLICNAPSEWDASHNESRFAVYKNPGQPFHGKESKYQRFLTFCRQFQFWEDIQPALTGHGVNTSSLWFFHPLQFVKHFRKANWLALREMTQLTPLVHM